MYSKNINIDVRHIGKFKCYINITTLNKTDRLGLNKL